MFSLFVRSVSLFLLVFLCFLLVFVAWARARFAVYHDPPGCPRLLQRCAVKDFHELLEAQSAIPILILGKLEGLIDYTNSGSLSGIDYRIVHEEKMCFIGFCKGDWAIIVRPAYRNEPQHSYIVLYLVLGRSPTGAETKKN